MARPAARANGTEKVFSPDGTGYKCRVPMTTATGPATVSTVFVQGVPPVVDGDKVAPHPKSLCGPDTSGCSSFSGKVFAGGKGVARIGDSYGNNKILSGAGKVIVG